MAVAGFGSKLEARVYRALRRAGWEQIDMQVPILGGRTVPGGQVIDFVLWPGPIPVFVNGEYWHRNDEVEFLEMAAVQEVYGREPVVIWGGEAQTDEQALATVLRKVGRVV